jgi:hypothetical protein
MIAPCQRDLQLVHPGLPIPKQLEVAIGVFRILERVDVLLVRRADPAEVRHAAVSSARLGSQRDVVCGAGAKRGQGGGVGDERSQRDVRDGSGRVVESLKA